MGLSILQTNSPSKLTCHDDPRGEVYPVLPLLPHAVPRDARVVPEVPLADLVDPQLCAVVADADPGRQLDVAVALEPDDLRSWSAAGLKKFAKINRAAKIQVAKSSYKAVQWEM